MVSRATAKRALVQYQTEPEVTIGGRSGRHAYPMTRVLKENIRLAKFSHYKIGGPARFFFAPKTEKELVWAAKRARSEKIPVFILGGGTNILIGEEGFGGLVLKPSFDFIRREGTRITVGAGVSMEKLLRYAAAHSLAGLEWAGGLPGAVGGAVRGNAGCFGGETKDVVLSVRSFNLRTRVFRTRTRGLCRFAYRSSIFKSHPGEVIISATFRLAKGNKKEIARVIKERIAYRKAHHPLEHPNIGSIFKNVPLGVIYDKGGTRYAHALAARATTYRGSSFSVKDDPFPVIFAAKLISESGLRGVSCGGAMISPFHPNFIVNSLGAEARDVKALMALVKAEVKRQYGVQLEEEIEVV